LEDHLQTQTTDWEARSLLAAALAAQGGVVLIDIVLEAATQSSSGSGSTSSPAAQVLAFLPEATALHLNFLKAANRQMATIPKAQLTASMRTQASLFLLFESLLFLKRLKENPSLLASLSISEAKAFAQNLAAAASLSAGQGNNPFAKATAEISTSLQRQPGADEKAKLTSFAAKLP
jgi:hypothetical protein